MTPGVGEWRQPEIVYDFVEFRGAIDDLPGLCVCILSLEELVRQVGWHLRRRGHLALVRASPYVFPGKRRWQVVLQRNLGSRPCYLCLDRSGVPDVRAALKIRHTEQRVGGRELVGRGK